MNTELNNKTMCNKGGSSSGMAISQYKPEVIEAMEEAKRISKDPQTKRYSSFHEGVRDDG